jgi:release factor glutamine methyltransferase
VSSGLAAKRSVAEALAVLRLDALERRLLLSRASGLSREDMARRPELLLDEEVTTEFDRLITEREAGQPIAYLLGEREFYGRSYKVDHRVLIPRPESELLVDIALQSIGRGPAKVLDIGTGSGCLAITLKLERPDWEVGALDISGDAINVASGNAWSKGAEISLCQADITIPDAPQSPLARLSPGSLDLVVSNPPYVAEGDPHLAQGDLRFEPKQALTDGFNGLRVIDAVITFSASRLKVGGQLLLEHGYDQAETVRQHLVAAGFGSVRSWPDLAGIERVSGGLATG